MASDLFKLLHIIGLCIGFGGALYCDCLSFNLLFSLENKKERLYFLDYAHKAIYGGLALILLSGTLLLFEKFNSIAEIPDKVWMKLGMFCMLILNSFFISRYAFPKLINSTSFILYSLKKEQLFLLFTIYATSLVGWVASLLFGSFSVFKTYDISMLTSICVGMWILFLFSTMAMAYFLKMVTGDFFQENISLKEQNQLIADQYEHKIQKYQGEISDLQNRLKRNKTQNIELIDLREAFLPELHERKHFPKRKLGIIPKPFQKNQRFMRVK